MLDEREPATRTEGRRERRRAQTRAALLNAAEHLFHEKGVGGTTVSAVAELADVGYGSFYNYFGTIDDVARDLAALSIQRTLSRVEEIMSQISDDRLLPCIGARLIIRNLLTDPVIQWMLERPYILVETFRQQAEPFMQRYEGPALAKGLLKPVVSHSAWMRTLPWILLSELTDTVANGNPEDHEESFALIAMRLMGIPDIDAAILLEKSLAFLPD